MGDILLFHNIVVEGKVTRIHNHNVWNCERLRGTSVFNLVRKIESLHKFFTPVCQNGQEKQDIFNFFPDLEIPDAE